MFMMVLAVTLSITPLGTYGNVYDIKEKDALVEFQDNAKKIDAQKIQSELTQKFKDYRPADTVVLTPAPKTRSYTIDLTYELEYDIPKVDSEGKIVGVLYPKGYRFNPVQYVKASPPPLVIFNGDSRKEREWVKHYYKSKPVMFVITEGNWADVSQELGKQVYYLKKIMQDKFKLEHTVSIVYKKDDLIKVDEYAVK
jgi:conjugal transfer pilus assembly protein TraW